ncbi:MAG: hypothetical protein LBG71_06255 [Clostridiales Family XIII bacterium]|nr:hypothetical protein [Clostridiales Family XIII bacterium]
MRGRRGNDGNSAEGLAGARSAWGADERAAGRPRAAEGPLGAHGAGALLAGCVEPRGLRADGTPAGPTGGPLGTHERRKGRWAPTGPAGALSAGCVETHGAYGLTERPRGPTRA